MTTGGTRAATPARASRRAAKPHVQDVGRHEARPHPQPQPCPSGAEERSTWVPQLRRILTAIRAQSAYHHSSESKKGSRQAPPWAHVALQPKLESQPQRKTGRQPQGHSRPSRRPGRCRRQQRRVSRRHSRSSKVSGCSLHSRPHRRRGCSSRSQPAARGPASAASQPAGSLRQALRQPQAPGRQDQ